MARRQFKIPFAATGDTVSIPNETQPDGSVSMQQGYGFDYQRDPQTDPLAKVFPRDVHNGLLNEITASIGEIQQQGYPIWTVDGAPYPINAVVRHSEKNWRSTIANNSAEPGTILGDTSWLDETGVAAERFNAAIASIASAATVDLNSGAANTSQITITGTASISAFTVSADRAFVVKFTGSCTLINSGALLTGTAANIVTAAGDSCIIRATAANTVEVIDYVRSSQTSLGQSQSWQVLTGSRSNATNYTNTTGRTIFVMVSEASASNVAFSVTVDGSVIASVVSSGATSVNTTQSFPVAPGSVYRVDGYTPGVWAEFR